METAAMMNTSALFRIRRKTVVVLAGVVFGIGAALTAAVQQGRSMARRTSDA
jgi:hypothetical protein